jgi:2-polyprenyl-3-methyl-5-hydroxy-6-metoxy-1,4-benzoquinol methylase
VPESGEETELNKIERTESEVERHIALMKEYYDRRAPWHDAYMSYAGAEAMADLMSLVTARFLPLIKDKTVLEIACGTGNWTQILARLARSVTAIDSSRACLEMARAKLSGSGTDVEFRECDAYQMEALTGRFDTMFAADWYSHMPRSYVPGFVNVACDLVEKGGSLVFLDMTPKEELNREHAGFDEEGNNICRRTLPDGSTYTIVKNFPTPDELRETFEARCSDFVYYSFPSLKRWLTVCRVN